jgi:hypothetical protein
MDDFEEHETNDQMESNQVTQSTLDINNSNQQHIDYEEQLHGIFSSQEHNESSSPVHMKAPTDFESWDMSNLIVEEAHPVADENDNNMQQHDMPLQTEGKKYKPFWAPNSSIANNTASPSQNLITQGPAVEFDNAFEFVPAQFTTHSTIEGEAEVAETLASIGLGSSARPPVFPETKSEKQLTTCGILKRSKDNLKPHEKKAQDLLFFGLSNFDATSSIASAESNKTNTRLDPMKKA